MSDDGYFLAESRPSASGTNLDGWPFINMGPLSQAMIDRFLANLAKTLSYHHYWGRVLNASITS
jgi:hypothetical protein